MSSPASSPSLRRIPPLSYTIQNVFFSISTVLAAYASLALTIFLVLPLSVIRMVLLLARDAYLYKQQREQQQQQHDKSKRKRKVVLVVGATHGIGLNIVKQYAHAEDDINVTIVAVGRSKGTSFLVLLRIHATVRSSAEFSRI
jgi:pheromone shutdown protein TraB